MSDTSNEARGYTDFPVFNADFNSRVVVRSDNLDWIQTENPGISVRPLEVAGYHAQRLTLIVRFEPETRYRLQQHFESEEILVLDGSLDIENQTCTPGYYIRYPHRSNLLHYSKNGCVLFVKLGEFASNDTSRRVIDTHSEEQWLPGPVEGTEVRALHMHDTRSVLMIRWLQQASFKPALDPQGEEVFVVRGRLIDIDGAYTQHHWIRNPIPAWQAWRGDAGTLVYYKNGHFPVPPDVNCSPPAM